MQSPLIANILFPFEHGFGCRNSPVPVAARLKQIHSDIVRTVRSANETIEDGDALVTNIPGTAVSVRTADCYPILFADPRNRAVAAVHAGWRGTAAHIVIRTLEKMNAEFGTQASDLVVAIGPGIGACCYEVGPEVAREFGYDARTHLELALENRKQLELAGVPSQKIEALGVCTFCDAERFFSYRREKEQAGRMTSFIRMPEIKPR